MPLGAELPRRDGSAALRGSCGDILQPAITGCNSFLDGNRVGNSARLSARRCGACRCGHRRWIASRHDSDIDVFARARLAWPTECRPGLSGLRHLTKNLVVTCSGNFSPPAFLCTVMALGIDNVLFSVDWPYESNVAAVDFLERQPLEQHDIEKVAHLNAERVLRL